MCGGIPSAKWGQTGIAARNIRPAQTPARGPGHGGPARRPKASFVSSGFHSIKGATHGLALLYLFMHFDHRPGHSDSSLRFL